jgi:hypothetical protein
MTKCYSRVAAALLIFFACAAARAETTEAKDKEAEAKPAAAAATTPAAKAPSTYEVLIKDAKTAKGYMTLHQKNTQLFAEIAPQHLNKDLFVLISIAKGIGQGSLLGGMSWNFGDDWIWNFRKVDKNIQIIRRNVRFVATPDTPEANAVKLAYTDSVMFSLPIITQSPGGADVVDLSSVFMSDLPQIQQVLRGFAFDPTRSTWSAVKVFNRNVELEVAAVYRSTGETNIPTVADSRSATINVHYSISELPNTGYKPRLADDRVGYFTTVLKDFSKKGDKDRFVQYINRWHLEKKDPSLAMSPPKEPIVFYLEKTIPIQYRKPIKDGILEWNKAFEKCGFIDAVEVRQQRDDDTWDPEDINYNTFRWITSGAGFAMGPSRVNPKTGQILDADIILDADFLQYWKQEFETFTPQSVAAMTGGPLDLATYHKEIAELPIHPGHNQWCACRKSSGMARQLALGATAMLAQDKPDVNLDKFILQALKDVTMHEVGHTFGLRHNFKASAFLTVAEANDPKNIGKPLAASVMDYTATNLVPKDMKQGDYFTPGIGPYDYWAIEYGYSTGSDDELKKLLARSGEPALAYTTDEDTRGIDPDPNSNRWDFGRNTLEFAAVRAQLVKELWPSIVDRVTKEGDGYQESRKAFGVLLSAHGTAMASAARNVGGLHTSRSHKGDKDAKPPFEVVDPKQQRAALSLLEEQVFSDKPFEFPPSLYNHLAATSDWHWGTLIPDRRDYPVHYVINMWQDRVLEQLLSSLTLSRLYDSELKVEADKDAFTAAELIERLTKAIFAEVDNTKDGKYTNRKPAVSSIRRSLQNSYLTRLAYIAKGSTDAPDDVRNIASMELSNLDGRIEKLLSSKVKLDTYTQAHMEAARTRIKKVLDAQMIQDAP